ncbi:GvpL/GvpF family gas vesicle protein [Streptomyces spongiae]|uniref:GvpL/GvpF family gas vesicle protein n=1 Tax=Streptomyces spongiae TaxID=565072 RepID=A0A5N8XF76_9ACTN|nr:GvpL/GvpF family gas vesicle protein [Streptomyces spongiae]MPY58131.1 GvpL/GvpF family gas vesicle protein [Streptomyces spongiae]
MTDTDTDTPTDTPTDTDIVYAYAVLRRTPEAARAVADLRGVAGEPIRLLEFADGTTDGTPGLAAAVGPVPAADFDEAPLKANLEDLSWLEATARAHHAVVAPLTGRGIALLPLRLVTVYRDEDRVRQALDARRDDFLPLLDRVTGHVELGVKIYAAPDSTPPEQKTDQETGQGTDQRTGQETAHGKRLGIGRAYLAGIRRRKRTAEDSWHAATRSASHITETAGALAADRVAHRPQSGDLAGPVPGPNVSNDAYLVPENSVDDFRTSVLAAAEKFPGVQVEVTGPWAPYSFALPPEPTP